MIDPIPLHCPYCETNASLTEASFYEASILLRTEDESKHGHLVMHVWYAVCPNVDCKERCIVVQLQELQHRNGYDPTRLRSYKQGKVVLKESILPRHNTKVLPAVVPDQIREDYREASSILDLSPKASATLSRRCLQTILRDYYKVDEPRLYHEILAIKDKVDAELWEAIDAIRKVGNIGAHPAKDPLLMIDVPADAARALIRLIELLIHETYVRDEERQKIIAQTTQAGNDVVTARQRHNQQEPNE